jgi:uncharacterized protein
MNAAPGNEQIAADAARLVEVLRSLNHVVVAFSGGVDSTVVAKAAALALGPQAKAVTGVSPSLAAGEAEKARGIAELIGIHHVFLETSEFENPNYLSNDGTRCYHCKSNLYDTLRAHPEIVGTAVICSGANLDDLGDYRPGLRAAAERNVRHPLQEAKLTKQAVRAIALFWELPNWDKPAAPCLSSRIAIGVEVTPERTQRVDAGERFLRELGLTVHRVRYHEGDVARIEVPEESLALLLDGEVRRRLVTYFKEIGFKFVALDLEGFRSGGLNVLVPAEILMASANDR